VFTYGGDIGDAFTLNSSVAAPHVDAQIKGCEIVLKSAISVGAASRSVSSKAAFEQGTKRLVQNMLKSMHIRLEIGFMYGQVGIARVESISGNDLVVCKHEWAAGIWSGAKNAPIEIRSQAGTLRGNAIVDNVDLDSRTISLDLMPGGVTGNVDPENAASDVIYFKGSYQKECAGLHKIMTNTGTIFNVDASQYTLFRANEVEVGTNAAAGTADISFEIIQQAITKSMDKGLADEDLTLLVNNKHWAKLLTEQAALREYDSSYSPKELENGSKSLKFVSQNGVIEIVASLFVKEGYAYLFPKSAFERIGSSDVTFEQPGFEGKFFRLMENQNGYELRGYSDQALFCDAIGQCTLLKYIKTP
jgi:hypothetical protein